MSRRRTPTSSALAVPSRAGAIAVLAGLTLIGAASPVLARQDGLSARQATDPYFTAGAAAVEAAAARPVRPARARNVILFIGDGMGISTVTASRIFDGQARGLDGESHALAFERLPYTGLSKTYSIDTQTPDSAATATALVSGVKTRSRVLGVGPSVTPGQCPGDRSANLVNIFDLARAAGRATGVVTTTRATHATPASAYAHSAHRDWEADALMPESARAGCVDIARQLVERPDRLNVMLGGGLAMFTPASAGGRRADGQDLRQTWAAREGSLSVGTSAELAAAVAARPRHLLGLFSADHMPYEAERAAGAPGPDLTAMTLAALDLLEADGEGYVLMVEGGRIDHASHANAAYGTLSETAALSTTVEAVLARVDLNDTLVIVTADHSHGLVMSGYAPRNSPILGLAGDEDAPILAGDGKPFTTLSFATGPGGPGVDEPRRDPTTEDPQSPTYRQNALIDLGSAAHSGEDVAIYADGPGASLISGVVEQSYVFHVMRRAMGLD